MPSLSSNPDSAFTPLSNLLQSAQEAYSRLFASMERSLSIDPEESPDLVDARERQVQVLMEEADARLQALRALIEPWSQKRASYSLAEAAQVEQFFAFLETTFESLQRQITNRSAELEQKKSMLQVAMSKLNQQRGAMKGYLQQAPDSRFINKKA